MDYYKANYQSYQMQGTLKKCQVISSPNLGHGLWTAIFQFTTVAWWGGFKTIAFHFVSKIVSEEMTFPLIKCEFRGKYWPNGTCHALLVVTHARFILTFHRPKTFFTSLSIVLRLPNKLRDVKEPHLSKPKINVLRSTKATTWGRGGGDAVLWNESYKLCRFAAKEKNVESVGTIFSATFWNRGWHIQYMILIYALADACF